MAKARIIRLQPAQPFNFRETLWFLDRNLDDCMHHADSVRARKAVTTSGGTALIEVRESNGELEIEILKGRGELDELESFVRDWFDVDRDLRPFYKILRHDKDLGFMAKKFRGFKIVGIPDLFECLVWCIAGQQINLPFAYTLKRRLVERYGSSLSHEGRLYHLFPVPDVLAKVPVPELRELQFTTRKAEYITGVARAFLDGELSKARLQALGSEEEMLRYLLGFRGIGRWSANYALMKSVRAMNRVPYGDAGLKQALQKWKNLNALTDREVDKALVPFDGWRTYIVFYFWRSLRDMA